MHFQSVSKLQLAWILLLTSSVVGIHAPRAASQDLIDTTSSSSLAPDLTGAGVNPVRAQNKTASDSNAGESSPDPQSTEDDFPGVLNSTESSSGPPGPSTDLTGAGVNPVRPPSDSNSTSGRNVTTRSVGDNSIFVDMVRTGILIANRRFPGRRMDVTAVKVDPEGNTTSPFAVSGVTIFLFFNATHSVKVQTADYARSTWLDPEVIKLNTMPAGKPYKWYEISMDISTAARLVQESGLGDEVCDMVILLKTTPPAQGGRPRGVEGTYFFFNQPDYQTGQRAIVVSMLGQIYVIRKPSDLDGWAEGSKIDEAGQVV